MNKVDREILARKIAKEAFDGKVDKGGAPYYGHLERVAIDAAHASPRAVEGSGYVVGMLHDLFEDTDADLYGPDFDWLSDDERAALDAITWRDDEAYADYIKRVAANSIARIVKLADLADNMDLSRIPNPSKADMMRLDKYSITKLFLESVDVK